MIPLLLALLGCGPEGAEDTSAPDPPWSDAPWARAQVLPGDRGRAFALDEDFLLEGVTVPTVLVAGEDRYLMLVTDMANWGRISLLESVDGVDWDPTPRQVLAREEVDPACDGDLVDAAVVPLDDGGFRVLVESSGADFARRLCSMTTLDGTEWTVEEGVRYAGSAADGGQVSVPEVVRMPDGRWFLYYLGDMGSVMGEGDGIRIAASDDGWSWRPLVEGNVLPSHDTDPFPVRLEGGGVRVYHTHPVTMGRFGYSESDDGLTFGATTWVEGLGEGTEPGEERWLDPAVLRLPDGRIALYMTRIVEEGGVISRAAVGRAWAVD